MWTIWVCEHGCDQCEHNVVINVKKAINVMWLIWT